MDSKLERCLGVATYGSNLKRSHHRCCPRIHLVRRNNRPTSFPCPGALFAHHTNPLLLFSEGIKANWFHGTLVRSSFSGNNGARRHLINQPPFFGVLVVACVIQVSSSKKGCPPPPSRCHPIVFSKRVPGGDVLSPFGSIVFGLLASETCVRRTLGVSG